MKKEKKSVINEQNFLGIVIQFIFTVFVLIFAILALAIHEKYFTILEIVMGIDFLAMAFNNYKVYHHKNMTILYIVVGLFLLVYALFTILGVIS